MEHRSVQRFRVSLPISFFWGTGTTFYEGSGASRDISTRGAFILTEEAVPAGSEIWLRVSVLGVREGSKGSQMQGTGQVVRVQTDGFAVEAAIGFSNQPDQKQERLIKRSLESAQSEPRRNVRQPSLVTSEK